MPLQKGVYDQKIQFSKAKQPKRNRVTLEKLVY
jgi:hypothetical protein